MIQVREAILSDAPFIVDSQLAMARETEDLALDPDTVHLGVLAVFRDRSKGVYWVAGVDHEVVACLITVPEWSDWRNGTVLWIHSVYVHSDFRRRGVYRTLYAHLKKKVEGDPALCGLRLFVEKKNKAAQLTYETLGMSNDHYELYEWLKK